MSGRPSTCVRGPAATSSKAARDEYRTRDWVGEICDVDYVECESEVDALLMESRLIKDVQPKHNRKLKDDKTFPYLMITTREDFPRVEVTREPRSSGVKLYGPSPARVPCAVPCRCCSGSSSSAPAPWTSRSTTSDGSGFAPACWPASTSARRRVICGSQGGVSPGHQAAADVPGR